MAEQKPAEKPAESPPQDLQAQQRKAAQEVEEQRQAAAARGEKPLDETVPGGRYLLDDGETLVDANGKRLPGAAAEKAKD